MTNLLPCPFCGGEALLCKSLHSVGGISHKAILVECNLCGCKTDEYVTDGCYGIRGAFQDAIIAWNRRADDDREKT